MRSVLLFIAGVCFGCALALGLALGARESDISYRELAHQATDGWRRCVDTLSSHARTAHGIHMRNGEVVRFDDGDSL